MGLFDVPEESFEIEILEVDLDVFNDKKIESEKIIDKDLLSKRTAVSQLKLPQTVWFGTVDNAATVDKDTFEEIMENVRARIRRARHLDFKMHSIYLG